MIRSAQWLGPYTDDLDYKLHTVKDLFIQCVSYCRYNNWKKKKKLVCTNYIGKFFILIFDPCGFLLLSMMQSLKLIKLFVCLFVLIWTSGRYSCTLTLACFLLACPTWRLVQKCPEKTTLSPHSLGLKGC